MISKNVIGCGMGVLLSMGAGTAKAQKDSKPNVLYIIMDDMCVTGLIILVATYRLKPLTSTVWQPVVFIFQMLTRRFHFAILPGLQ